jgi:hypothetical protein
MSKCLVGGVFETNTVLGQNPAATWPNRATQPAVDLTQIIETVARAPGPWCLRRRACKLLPFSHVLWRRGRF